MRVQTFSIISVTMCLILINVFMPQSFLPGEVYDGVYDGEKRGRLAASHRVQELPADRRR